MPWIGSRAICDGCSAASKDADFTGKRMLKKIGAYVPKGNGSEVIYCPLCILTEDDARGGLTVFSMTEDMAQTLFEQHWHSPAEALELGYTTRIVQGEARPEPPETPVGHRDQNHPSQQVPPGMIQGVALTPAFAIQDVPGRVELQAEVDMLKTDVSDLTAEVNTLKAEVHELKDELKQHKQLIETFQNEVRTLKEQVSGQPSQSSSVWQGSSWQRLSWQS